jgi:hypothetical protein
MFLSDKKVGESGESDILLVLRRADLEVGKNRAETRKGRGNYDVWFKLNNSRFTIEVKKDMYEARSGNLALEYFNPKSKTPSGISATKANLWAFVLSDGSVWIARTSDVKRHKDKGRGGQGFVRDLAVAGDNNASVILYRRDDLFDIAFFRIDNVTRNELVALLEILTK